VTTSLDRTLDTVPAAAESARELLVRHGPTVLTGLAILLFGWLASRLLRALIERTLRAVRLDSAVEGTRVQALLAALGKKATPSRVVAQLAYLTLILLTLNTVAGYWGLTGLQGALSAAVGYLPRALSALGLFAGGAYLAGVAKRGVGAVLRELRNPAAGVLETLTEAGILLIVTLVALDLLGVNLTFITSNLTLLLGAVLLVVAFLACWAMRAPAEELVANYYLRRMLSVGDHVETKTHQGTVLEFVPLGLILRDPTGDEHFVPARELITGLRRRQGLKPD
jgi:small-conductance mechanosensitive channel